MTPSPPLPLAGRVAFVTGGGSGLGLAIARALATAGADLALLGRDAARLEAAASSLAPTGRRVLTFAADVRQPDAVVAAVDAAASALGRLDILVNSAAGNFLCPADQLTPNGLSAVVDIDLKGTFHACRAALPHLSKGGGVILNVSATLQLPATPLQMHASAAKAGLDSLTRSLALEWGRRGIRVLGIAPGPVAGTEGVKRLLPGAVGDALAARTPLGRLGTPDDIADAALFLVSEQARWITGVTLVADGGLHLAGPMDLTPGMPQTPK